MRTFWYVLDLNPEPWRVGPVTAYRSKESHKVAGKVGRDQQLFAFESAVTAELVRQGARKLDAGQKFQLTLFLWRNMSEYKTSQSRVARNQEADGTNMLKAIEDACQKVLFDNDKDNVHGEFFIMDQGPKVTGRIVIRLQELAATHYDDLKEIFPEEVYGKLYGSSGEQLALAVSSANTVIAADDSKYAEADVSEVF